MGNGSLLLGVDGVELSQPAVPSSRSLLGMFSKQSSTYTTEQTSIAHRESQIGRLMDQQLVYFGWQDGSSVASNAVVTDAIANSRIPHLAWGFGDAPACTTISGGTQDGYIDAMAASCKARGVPILLRPLLEMNLSGAGSYANDSANFPTAWRYVVNRFRAAGVTNVSFVWCPNSSSTTSGTTPNGSNSWRNYYPGDAYVDWLACDAYNFGSPTDTWLWFDKVAYPILNDFATGMGGTGGTGKPIMVGESGCNQNSSSDSNGKGKGLWYTLMSGRLRTLGVKNYTFFDTDTSGTGIHWNVDSDTDATAGFLEMAADSYWGGTGTTGSGYAAAVMADTPIAYWKFGETSGTVADSSGNGNNGTVGGSGTYPMTYGCAPYKPGLGSYAAGFIGGGQIDVGTLGNFGSNMGAGFTIELLYKSDLLGKWGAAIAELNTGTTMAINLSMNMDHTQTESSGKTTLWWRGNTGTVGYVETTAAVYDGLWHHLVFVMNPGSTHSVYVDGAAVTPSATSAGSASNYANFGFGIYIGARNSRGSADKPFTGALDEVAIYASKLSSGRVTAHYTALTT